MRVKDLDVLLTTLMGLVLLLVLMLAMSPSPADSLKLSSRLIYSADTEMKWPKTQWNSFYENSTEKYGPKITSKQKGKTPSEAPVRRTEGDRVTEEESERIKKRLQDKAIHM